MNLEEVKETFKLKLQTRLLVFNRHTFEHWLEWIICHLTDTNDLS